MKRKRSLLIAAAAVISAAYILAANAYGSDYKGNERNESIFQKLGDFITGKYEVNNQPIKKTGIFQVIADETKKMEPASSQ